MDLQDAWEIIMALALVTMQDMELKPDRTPEEIHEVAVACRAFDLVRNTNHRPIYEAQPPKRGLILLGRT